LSDVKEHNYSNHVVTAGTHENHLSFPVVHAKKNDNIVRLCVDYRKLNNIIITDAFALPHRRDHFDIG
jgi:hypothetical protein